MSSNSRKTSIELQPTFLIQCTKIDMFCYMGAGVSKVIQRFEHSHSQL